MGSFKAFMPDERGATAIEYGLIAALISVAIIVILGKLGENLETTFVSIAEAMIPAEGG